MDRAPSDLDPAVNDDDDFVYEYKENAGLAGTGSMVYVAVSSWMLTALSA